MVVAAAAAICGTVTGDTYLFDPTSDIFAGQAPITTAVTVQEAPAGGGRARCRPPSPNWPPLSRRRGGRFGSREYFSLRFNQGYIVGIDQVPLPAAP